LQAIYNFTEVSCSCKSHTPTTVSMALPTKSQMEKLIRLSTPHPSFQMVGQHMLWNA